MAMSRSVLFHIRVLFAKPAILFHWVKFVGKDALERDLDLAPQLQKNCSDGCRHSKSDNMRNCKWMYGQGACSGCRE